MAQDMQPSNTERTKAAQTDSGLEDDDDGFHYYSGGEVRELEGTKLSPIYLWFIVILVTVAVIYFIFGGALPGIHRYRPEGGSAAFQQSLREGLVSHDQALGTLSNIDLDKLPLPAGQTLDGAISRGADLYQTYCIGCHGPNQDGNGINSSGLNPKPRNLRDAPFMQSMSLERINQSLHRGVPGTAMPRWENTLNDTQIQDVIAYVWSLTSPKPVAGSTETTAAAPATSTYVGGVQSSPTPTNVPVNGNTAAPQSTAPPSTSGANVTTGGTTTVLTAPYGGKATAPAASAPAATPAPATATAVPTSQVKSPVENGSPAATAPKAPTASTTP